MFFGSCMSDYEFVIIIYKEGSTKIIDFIISGARVLVCLSVITLTIVQNTSFLEKSSLLFSARKSQTARVYSNDEHGRVYQNCRFH